jgi:hypothetical protein
MSNYGEVPSSGEKQMKETKAGKKGDARIWIVGVFVDLWEAEEQRPEKTA